MPLAPSTAPTTLGGFTLLERIGKGGMGEVYRAERIGPASVRRRAAVKRILPEFQRDAELRARFLAEARITARLEHPNIVQLIDFGDQPELYLVLEYIEGTALAELMRDAARGRGVLPVSAVLFILAEAAAGLDHAHRKLDDAGQPLGIVHRDVSPPNILVSFDGAVKVSDFGIARAADNSLRTMAGHSIGKLVYMSPEQALARPVDRRTDVFALGIVLWEALTLKPLLPRDSPDKTLEALERCQFPAPSTLVPGLPPAVDSIVAAALAHDPEQRTPSAGRLGRALREVLHQLSPGFDSRDLAAIVAQLSPDARLGSVEPGTPAHPAQAAAPHPVPIAAPIPTAVAHPPPAPAPLVAAQPPPAPTPRPPALPPTSPHSVVPILPAGTQPPSAASPPRVAARRARWPWLLGATVLLIGALAAGWYFLVPTNDSGADTSPASTAPPLTASNTAPPTLATTATTDIAGLVATYARTCAFQSQLLNVSGTVVVDGIFNPGTVPTNVAIRVNTGSGLDPTLADCIHGLLVGGLLPSNVTPATVQQLSVSF